MNGTSDELAQLKSEIRERFAKLVRAPHEEETFLVGPMSAKRLGYDAAEIDGLPAALTESFAGVGNPLALEPLRAGETVLDLGSGAGLDSILAARRVGLTGRVIGIDFGTEMVEKATSQVSPLGGMASIAFTFDQLREPTARRVWRCARA